MDNGIQYLRGTKAYYDNIKTENKKTNEKILIKVKQKYYTEQLSIKKVSELIGIPTTSLQRLMIASGLKLRSRSEALSLHLKNNPEAHQHTSSPFKDPDIQRKGAIASGNMRKGKTIEELHGIDEAKRLRKLYSEQRSGDKNVNFGKKRPQHVCDALSKAHKGIPQPMEYKIRRLKKAFEKLRISPNKLETRLIDLINKHQLPFKFVGDGALIINGMCPDFVGIEDHSLLIEIFGEYWHGNMDLEVSYNRTEKGRTEVFSDLGYRTLIIWENDMNEMTNDELLKIVTDFYTNRKDIKTDMENDI